MLCTIFLAEETSVRKTVTALVSKTLQKCNGHWRTRAYERKQQSVGILVARCLASKDLMPVGIPTFANYRRAAFLPGTVAALHDGPLTDIRTHVRATLGLPL